MSRKGYDVFFTKPDEQEAMYCKVCNTLCQVERSLTGPTGYIEAMGGRGHWHDQFTCPNSGKPWHEQALELILAIESTPSKRVARLMRLDLNDLLRKHLG
jgi:hypothetical protein